MENAVRYALRRALEREADRVTIHVGGLRYDPGTEPPTTTPSLAAESVDDGQAGDEADGPREAGGDAGDAA